MNQIISREIQISRCLVSCRNLKWTHKHKQRFLLAPAPVAVSSDRKFTQNFWQSVSESTPVTTCQDWIIQLHEFTGLPWWTSIILSTFLMRSIITFPLALYQTKILAKVEQISEEMPEIVKELKVETAYAIKKYNLTDVQARFMYNKSLKKQWHALIVRENCHPLKATILLWFQIPLWITNSWAIRNMIYLQPDPDSLTAQIVATQLLVGGFGWIPNLTDVDHSLILPISLGVLNLTIVEIQNMSKKIQVNSRFQKYATNFFRILSVCMVPIAAMVPSGLCIYWVSSSIFGLMQNLAILSPRVRRLGGIPKTKSEHDKPYEFLAEKIKTRFGIKP